MAKSKFSLQTIEFIKTASRQKRPDWLDRNRVSYEKLVLEPLKNLAGRVKSKLGPIVPDYHFPQKGIGRLKRPANRVGEYGGGHFKRWLSYSASRPRKSRFDHNPNLYFMIDVDDPKEGILVAGGLYMPSSRQLRAIREAIASDASEFDRLFASKSFSRHFKGGFSDERISSRPPRGFDPAHPRMDWLRLQAFFVWRPYTKKQFVSPGFPDLLASDWEQITRLNALLDAAIQRSASSNLMRQEPAWRSSSLLERLEELPDRRAQ